MKKLYYLFFAIATIAALISCAVSNDPRNQFEGSWTVSKVKHQYYLGTKLVNHDAINFEKDSVGVTYRFVFSPSDTLYCYRNDTLLYSNVYAVDDNWIHFKQDNYEPMKFHVTNHGHSMMTLESNELVRSSSDTTCVVVLTLKR